MEVSIGTSTSLTINLSPEDFDLDAVVISASRRQENIDAPASISLITTEQLKNTVAITPMANIKGVPGLIL